MGTRDKVLGDAHVVRPMEQKAESKIDDTDTGTEGEQSSSQEIVDPSK